MRRPSLRAAAWLLLAVPAVAAAQAGPAAPAARGAGYIPADIDFLTGMIAHHAQAIMMSKWAPGHGASSSIQDLCARIVVSQRDEITAMQRWLRDRGLPAPAPDTLWHGAAMPAMPSMPGAQAPMLMPGMLSAAQLAQLDSARGGVFDQLFLLDMIQHHQGAIRMVRDLLAVPGAAQDGLLYTIASNINVDQTTEIARMRRMLLPMLTGGTSP